MTRNIANRTNDTVDGATQWQAQTLQMVNWGGFHGHHQMRVSPGSTLLSGASGTGKSTLLDAYLALMMPSDTPFNGASNDATVGRARSADQRNLLTYLRGKTDDNRVEGTDEMRDQVLRGLDGAPTWGAIAMTFINDSQRLYTVMRLYFVKAGASANPDVSTTFATVDGYLDLAHLEPLAAVRFNKRTLEARFPSIQLFYKFWEFEQNLHTRLGIGANGDGRKALRLLARVQSGMQVKSVDSLYKSMVLEEPVTYKKADEALSHFTDLEAAYEKMLDESEKARVLRRLPDLHADLRRARQQALLIDQFGIQRDSDSPFLLWKLRTERALLDIAVEANRADRAQHSTAFTTARDDERRLRERLQAITEDKKSNGGDTVGRLTEQIATLGDRRTEAHTASLKFQSRTTIIRLDPPSSAQEFADAVSTSHEFLRDCPARIAEYDAQAQHIGQDEEFPLSRERTELIKERESLTGRNGMVPRHLHLARVVMAEAAGLDPMNDLPFVAELIDVKNEEESWRKAIETTLGGLARVILVNKETREHLSRCIDGIRIRPRMNFRGVELAVHRTMRGKSDHVSDKVTFQASPFSSWVHTEVTSLRNDHLCVADTTELSGPGPRVTPSGQTRNGDRGAHGENSDGSIIGFSNERRLGDLSADIEHLDTQLAHAHKRIRDIREHTQALREQSDSHKYVTDTTWIDLDYASIDQRISDLEGERGRFVAASNILTRLQQEEVRLTPLHKEAYTNMVLAEAGIQTLDTQHGNLVDSQDAVSRDSERIEDSEAATLTDEQAAHLSSVFVREFDATDLAAFPVNIKNLKQRLAQDLAAAHKAITDISKTMTGIFESFQDRWHDGNLGTAVESEDGYREILDRIHATGLHERKEDWKRNLAEWSSEDLVQVNGAFDGAIEDIEQRLEPVNAILKELPFGGKGHLQINLRRLHSEDVTTFRKTLRTLASGVATEQTDNQIEERFKRLQAFMNLIRIPQGHTKTSTTQRDKYLDVRQHVIITAACLNDEGHEIATYAALGGKSGGETQELVAFIVGAALRFQLGDESRTRPRFAPVFLDEGFVKSDSEFAGRAIRAWQSLGFQLIIGAPLDKVTALEPHMNLILTMTKNSKGHSFITDLPPTSSVG